MRRLKIAGMVVALTLGVAAFAAALLPPTDLRPQGMDASGANQARGRELLAVQAQRLGGLARWRAARATRVELVDYWAEGLMKTVGCPWREGERMELTFLNGRDMGRITFRDSDRAGSVWGIQNWVTYTETPDGARSWAPDNNVKFWVPTIQYFVEMPFRLVEAQNVTLAGEREVNGTTYDLVYATWGGFEPKSDVDQYVAWVNRETGLADYVQYTVRDFGKWITGMAHYRKRREVDGLLMPVTINVGGEPGKPETLHRFDIASVQFLPQLADEHIIVEPARSGSKQ